MDNEQLQHLADLLDIRNSTEKAIARLLNRPGLSGNIGELISSKVFSIELETRGNHPGYDGHFTKGHLRGKTVNIKTKNRYGTGLNINPKVPIPDYYLVLRGGKSKKGEGLPWTISEIFLFDANILNTHLRERGVQIRENTSITKAEWEAARVYPDSPTSPLPLTDGQIERVHMFDGSQK